jgi:pimeloyl-ACP methyl ester carboxylesterase
LLHLAPLKKRGIVKKRLSLHPEKVNKLILYASDCGGKESVPPSPQAGQQILSNPQALSAVIKNLTQIAKAFLPLLFPQKYISENPSFVPKFLSMFQTLKEIDPVPTITRQLQAISNWKGTCNLLPTISNPTLVITRTDDVTVPPANSLIIAQKIPGSWLLQKKEED